MQEEQKPTEVVAPKQNHLGKRLAFYLLLAITLCLLVLVGYMTVLLRDKSQGIVGTQGGISGLSGDPYNLQGPAIGISGNPQSGQPTPAAPADTPPADPSGKPEQWVTVDWLPAWKGRPEACMQQRGCENDVSLVGKVVSGPYAGKDVYIRLIYELGTTIQHFVKEGDKEVVFEEENIKMRGVSDAPATIVWQGTSYTLEKGWVEAAFANIEREPLPAFTSSQFGPVYIEKNRKCFFVELPDHTALGYNINLPFVNNENTVIANWEDNKPRSENYTYTIPTCGGMCTYLNFKSKEEVNPDQRLLLVGKTSNGDSLYGLKNPNDEELKKLYNDKNSVAYMKDPSSGNYEQTDKSRYTYQQFLSYYPLLFWRDPLGRYVEFTNQRFIPAAEMCKPVIYLYPMHSMDVSVYIMPNGGLSKTIPFYGTGWHVTARPNGDIVNKADGKTYNYLFWEGLGLQYPRPETGFVVATDNVGKFFDETLPKLGLGGREIADFKEYWVPRLESTGKSYVLLHFMTKEEFTALAPLKVTPVQPDTIIRVMMTARPLDGAAPFQKQELPKTPVRSGFTFVEWGGAVVR